MLDQISNHDQFTVRISGKYQYVENPCISLYSIRYVQECIKRQKKIKFTLELKNANPLETVSVFYVFLPCFGK